MSAWLSMVVCHCRVREKNCVAAVGPVEIGVTVEKKDEGEDDEKIDIMARVSFVFAGW